MSSKQSQNSVKKNMSNKRQPKVVLDSAILVSAFLTKGGLSSHLLILCGEKATLYTAEEILQETRRVLLEEDRIRKKYTYRDEDVEEFLEAVREMSEIVEFLPELHVIDRDPKDDKILACALTVHTDYIVSRDRDLLDLGEYQGVKIVTPEEFIQYLRDHE